MQYCCLLVYGISKKSTFEECIYYIEQIKERYKKNVKVILLGNKTDLTREVPSEEGAKLAQKNKYFFQETSCLNNINVANAFQTLIEIINIEIRKNNTN